MNAIIQVTDGQLLPGEELRLALTNLQALARGVKVTDKASCDEALVIVGKCRDQIKMIKAAAEPERLRLQNQLDYLRRQREVIILDFFQIQVALEVQARLWNEKERQAAEAEQAKLNRRKDGGDVTVKPNLGHASGVRLQTHYRFEIIHPERVKKEFLCPDEVRIGQKVREDKDPEASMRAVGGIRAWRE